MGKGGGKKYLGFKLFLTSCSKENWVEAQNEYKTYVYEIYIINGLKSDKIGYGKGQYMLTNESHSKETHQDNT